MRISKLADPAQISEPYKRLAAAGEGITRLDALAEAVARRIALTIDTTEAVGKLAELKKLIDSLGDE